MSAALITLLHLEAVLPALAVLAPYDEELRRAAAGTGDFSVVLMTRGVPARCRLTFSAAGSITAAEASPSGALRLWFPSPGQFLRTMAQKPACVLPLGGWTALRYVSRFSAAGRRLDELLRDPKPSPALFAFGNLAVGLAGAAALLRYKPDARRQLAGFGEGVVTFACPALPAPLWIDTGTLQWGAGLAPRATLAELVFNDLETLLAELSHRLDALAALGGGELRIRGHLLLAERLGLVLTEVGHLLNPPVSLPPPLS
jgi:hypothetical protein